MDKIDIETFECGKLSYNTLQRLKTKIPERLNCVFVVHMQQIRPRGNKTFFMLNSIACKLSDAVFIMLLNVKCQQLLAFKHL